MAVDQVPGEREMSHRLAILLAYKACSHCGQPASERLSGFWLNLGRGPSYYAPIYTCADCRAEMDEGR